MVDSDTPTPVSGFGSAAQWGLASLLIGCTLLMASWTTMVFNALRARGGLPEGIPPSLAFAGILIGVVVVAALGVASLVFGIRGWQQARSDQLSPALGIAGVAASVTGLLLWLMAGISLIIVYQSITR